MDTSTAFRKPDNFMDESQRIIPTVEGLHNTGDIQKSGCVDGIRLQDGFFYFSGNPAFGALTQGGNVGVG
jgi:hypothetical protein